MTVTQTNASRVLIDITESAIRGWAGDVDRAKAAMLLAAWSFRDALDDELTARVLDRFRVDSDPVPGKDFLPDAPSVPPLTADELGDWLREDPVTNEKLPDGVEGHQLGRAAVMS